MIPRIVYALVVITLCCLTENGYAQGCSDAGFCTIGNLATKGIDSVQHKQKLTLLLPMGIGDESVFVFTPGIQYENRFSERWSIQARLTANYADGNLGNAFGPGDFFFSATHQFSSKSEWHASVTLGTKVFLSDGNLKEGGRSLPMQYQSSLGTVDLITGLSLNGRAWQFSAGYQQPVTGENSNMFLPSDWGTQEAEKYPASNKFKRKGDVLLRAAYTLAVRRVSISPGLLGIYHLADDAYTDEDEVETIIAGSQGLTLNLTVAATWRASDRVDIVLLAGAPLLFRDVRPDGLTRKFVFAPEIVFKF